MPHGLQASHLHDLNPDAAGITYEVRVYSLEAATLGQVLHAKQIKAAHCLTSVQFSPTSEHLLLAYGRSVMFVWSEAESPVLQCLAVVFCSSMTSVIQLHCFKLSLHHLGLLAGIAEMDCFTFADLQCCTVAMHLACSCSALNMTSSGYKAIFLCIR